MKINAQIKNLCQQIVENFKPQKIILFGSHAYGKPNADSDVDLLVVMPFTRTRFTKGYRNQNKDSDDRAAWFISQNIQRGFFDDLCYEIPLSGKFVQ